MYSVCKNNAFFVFLIFYFLTQQTEKAYQKQAPIFQNKKRVLGQTTKKKDVRFVKSVGLGFKTPRDVSPELRIGAGCRLKPAIS